VVVTVDDMKSTFFSPSELHGITMSKKQVQACVYDRKA